MKPPPDCVNPGHWMDAKEAMSTMVFMNADGTPKKPLTHEEVAAFWEKTFGPTANADGDEKLVAETALTARLAKDGVRRERLNG